MTQQITWRNVDAPDMSPAARILENAGNQMNRGFEGLQGLFKDARARQIDTRSAEALGMLAGVDSASEVDSALARVLGQTAARDRNGALLQSIEGLRGRALGYDNTRSTIADRGARLSLAQAANNRQQADWAWEDARRREDYNEEQEEEALGDWARESVYGMVNNLDLDNPIQSFNDQVMLRKDLTPDQRDALLAAGREIIEGNAGYFTGDGSGSTLLNTSSTSQIASDIARIEEEATIAGVFNPSLRQVDGPSGSAEGPDGSGSATAASATSTVAAQMAALNSQLGTDDNPNPLDQDSVLSMVQRIARNTNLPVELVMSRVGNALDNKGPFSNRITVNEDNLLRELEPYVDENGQRSEQKMRNALQQNRMIQVNLERARTIQSSLQALNSEMNVLNRRFQQDPTNVGIQRQRQAIMSEFMLLRNELSGLAGAPGPGGPAGGTTAPGTGTAANPPVSTPPATPRTPPNTGPQANNGRNQTRAPENLENALTGIQSQLSWQGGSPLSSVRINASNYFNPQDEKDAARLQMRENREALEFFRSQEAENMFKQDPLLLAEAQNDPIAFFNRIKNP